MNQELEKLKDELKTTNIRNITLQRQIESLTQFKHLENPLDLTEFSTNKKSMKGEAWSDD